MERIWIEDVIKQIEKVIVGKRDAVVLIVKAMLCGGHILLEDVPGVGKTMLVRALAKSTECDFKRIQFTPDLLPADITGCNMYHPSRAEFEFKPGPLFASIVLADELNRASPKTQSALLEAMEERKITVDGQSYSLPKPFMILATQNPKRFEGTYTLPEAQLDRFMFRVRLGYPQVSEEVEMLDRVQQQEPIKQLRSVIYPEEILKIRRAVFRVHVDPSIKHYIAELSAATRNHEALYMGVSPRASIALMRAAQVHAWWDQRNYVLPDDVKAMFTPTWAHRVLYETSFTTTDAEKESVFQHILRQVKTPDSGFAKAQ